MCKGTNLWISYDGRLGNKKCASLDTLKIVLTTKTNLIHSFINKTGFSYNMRDPIQGWGGEENKIKRKQKSRAIKMANSAANLISIFFLRLSSYLLSQ